VAGEWDCAEGGGSANCPSDIEKRADKGNHDIIGNGTAFFAAFCPSYMPIDSAAFEHDIFVTACHVEFSGTHIEVSREKFDPLRSSREHAIDHVTSAQDENPPARHGPGNPAKCPRRKQVALSNSIINRLLRRRSGGRDYSFVDPNDTE
jgi:hypothetical protein